MRGSNSYIEGLDIPESDKELLYKFAEMCWEDIRWWECESERGKEAARDIMRAKRCRDEHEEGID